MPQTLSTYVRTPAQYFLLFSIILLAHKTTYGSHAGGAGISYRCIGPNTYEVTLWTSFRCPVANTTYTYLNIANDCNLLNPAQDTTKNYGSSPSIWKLDTVKGLTNINNSKVCRQQLGSTKCNGGTGLGYNVTTFIDTIVLPDTCNNWTFSYVGCCLETTTNGTGTPGVYVETKMHSADFPCDNSPVVIGAKPIFGCTNITTCVDLNVIDPDNDSLVYSLVSARSNPTTPITYSAPYSGSMPVNNALINSQTGELCFNATGGNYVVAVKITAYDKASGKIKSETFYETMIVIEICGNTPDAPKGYVTNASGAGSWIDSSTVQVCQAGSLCVDIVVSDTNVTDTISITKHNLYTIFGSGAQISMTGTNPLTIHVCGNAPLIPGDYQFWVMANDSACPRFIEKAQRFRLKVSGGLNVNVGNDTTISCMTTVNLKCKANGGSGAYKYQWVGNRTGTSDTLNNVWPGTYYCYVQDTLGNMCGGIDTINIKGPGIVPDFSFSKACEKDWIQFTDLSSSNTGLTGWKWSFGDGGTSVSQNPQHMYNSNGAYNVKLVVSDLNGCKDSVSKVVNVHPKPKADFYADSVCNGAWTCFTDSSSVIGDTIGHWYWNFNDGYPLDSTYNPCHYYAVPGIFNPELIVESSFGCRDTISRNVVVLNSPKTTLTVATGKTLICRGDSVTIKATGADAYTWSPFFVIGDTYKGVIWNNRNFIVVGMDTITGCKDTAYQQIQTIFPPIANPVVSSQTTCTGLPVLFDGTLSVYDTTYSWIFSGGSPGTSNVAQPSVNYTTPGVYPVTLVVSNKVCTDTNTIVITVTWCTGITEDADDGKNLTLGVGKELLLAHFVGWDNGVYMYKIMGADGGLVYNGKANIESPDVYVQVPIRNLAPGMYFISFNHGTDRYVQKFVVAGY